MILDFYEKAKTSLLAEKRGVLLMVIANEGSSPGRKGFKMFVTSNQMYGTIGGGIMEHKLVEYARTLLDKPTFLPFIKHQIHDKSAAFDQSGMICSGRQTIAFFDLNEADLDCIDLILSSKHSQIYYSDKGIQVSRKETFPDWEFTEPISTTNKVYIIGGGHVGLALSEVLSRLDFQIHLLDNRENLNTMQENAFVHSKQIVEFESVEQHIPEGNHVYVVIMSFGYRTDDIIIRRLLGRQFRFLGMLGSQEKIKTLYKNLLKHGFTQEQLDTVYAPIGIDIKSETAAEIAISVAAQLIQIKNKVRL